MRLEKYNFFIGEFISRVKKFIKTKSGNEAAIITLFIIYLKKNLTDEQIEIIYNFYNREDDFLERFLEDVLNLILAELAKNKRESIFKEELNVFFTKYWPAQFDAIKKKTISIFQEKYKELNEDDVSSITSMIYHNPDYETGIFQKEISLTNLELKQIIAEEQAKKNNNEFYSFYFFLYVYESIKDTIVEQGIENPQQIVETEAHINNPFPTEITYENISKYFNLEEYEKIEKPINEYKKHILSIDSLLNISWSQITNEKKRSELDSKLRDYIYNLRTLYLNCFYDKEPNFNNMTIIAMFDLETLNNRLICIRSIRLLIEFLLKFDVLFVSKQIYLIKKALALFEIWDEKNQGLTDIPQFLLSKSNDVYFTNLKKKTYKIKERNIPKLKVNDDFALTYLLENKCEINEMPFRDSTKAIYIRYYENINVSSLDDISDSPNKILEIKYKVKSLLNSLIKNFNDNMESWSENLYQNETEKRTKMLSELLDSLIIVYVYLDLEEFIDLKQASFFDRNIEIRENVFQLKYEEFKKEVNVEDYKEKKQSNSNVEEEVEIQDPVQDYLDEVLGLGESDLRNSSVISARPKFELRNSSSVGLGLNNKLNDTLSTILALYKSQESRNALLVLAGLYSRLPGELELDDCKYLKFLDEEADYSNLSDSIILLKTKQIEAHGIASFVGVQLDLKRIVREKRLSYFLFGLFLYLRESLLLYMKKNQIKIKTVEDISNFNNLISKSIRNLMNELKEQLEEELQSK